MEVLFQQKSRAAPIASRGLWITGDVKACATQEKISVIFICIILISIQMCYSLYLVQECVWKETIQEKDLEIFTGKVHKE